MAVGGHTQIAQALLDAGADPRARNVVSFTMTILLRMLLSYQCELTVCDFKLFGLLGIFGADERHAASHGCWRGPFRDHRAADPSRGRHRSQERCLSSKSSLLQPNSQSLCYILGHDAHPQTKCELTPMQPVQDGETPLDFAKDSSMEEEFHEAVSRAKIPQ